MLGILQKLSDKIMEHSDICALGYGLEGAVPLSAYWDDEKSKLDVLECAVCNANILDFRLEEGA